MTEVWAGIPSAPGYCVSNTGRVRGPRGELSTPATKRGYLTCSLRAGRKKITTTVQRLVLEAFAGPAPTPEHEANHKNGRKADNRPDNLEWVTRQENMDHAWQTGLCKPRPKKAKPNPDLPPMGVVQTWRFSGDGWCCVAHLLVPRDIGRNRPRSDHFTLLVNDRQVADRVTAAAAFRLIQADHLPRPATRAQRAEAASWANVRPDFDAAAAQMEA